jgi:inhibitor of cysteine peptidase
MIKEMVKFSWLVMLMVVTGAQAQEDKSIFTDPANAIIVEKPNTEFEITLKSNPTTGFSWTLKKYDADIIAHVKNQFYPSARTNPPIVGAPGCERWTFKVIDLGFFKNSQSTDITLIYRRPWNNEVAETLTFKVINKKVVIKDAN